jgi:ATP-dependent metalloprotease
MLGLQGLRYVVRCGELASQGRRIMSALARRASGNANPIRHPPFNRSQQAPGLQGLHRTCCTSASAAAMPGIKPKLDTELLKRADENLDDAELQAKLLQHMNTVDHGAVLDRFHRVNFAVNEEAIKQYVKALVVANPALNDMLMTLMTNLLLVASTGKLRSLVASTQVLAANPDVSAQASQTSQPQGEASYSSWYSRFSFFEKKPKPAPSVLNSTRGTKDFPFYVMAVPSTSNKVFWFIVGAVAGIVIAQFVVVSVSKSVMGGAPFGLEMNFAQEEFPNTTFEAVKGCDEAKDDLQDIVLYLKDPEKFKRMEVTMPKGVLLVGPPGCGKTLLAKALAGEAGVPFFSVSGSQFEEMLVGVGSSRIRKLFAAARQHSPCIVFIDELDALGERRDRFETRTKLTLNQLLVELDGFRENSGIVVIGATNLESVLDPALTRAGRFDRRVAIDLPDKRVRSEILKHYLKDKGSADVNIEEIAGLTTGCSGADLYNLVNWARIEAVKQNITLISHRLMHDALDNITMGRQKKATVLSDDTKKQVAYHEAGHALVSLYTPGSNALVKATLIPRGMSLGSTWSLPAEEQLTSHEQMLATLDRAMGGRAAEELIFGPSKVSNGASDDFAKGTAVAEAMVKVYGLNKNIGKVSLRDRKISAHLHAQVDDEIKQITEASYSRAIKILTDHKNELHFLANALLQYETLTAEEITEVIKGKQLHRQPTLASLPVTSPTKQRVTEAGEVPLHA